MFLFFSWIISLYPSVPEWPSDHWQNGDKRTIVEFLLVQSKLASRRLNFQGVLCRADQSDTLVGISFPSACCHWWSNPMWILLLAACRCIPRDRRHLLAWRNHLWAVHFKKGKRVLIKDFINTCLLIHIFFLFIFMLNVFFLMCN